MRPDDLDFDTLRSQIIGVDSTFWTPFGERMLIYCDYTASGRCLHFIERYLMNLQRRYANTHTEDDVTGRSMTRLLHDAEHSIKRSLNAGPGGRIIACGTGATAAIDKLQQMLGVAIPPATRARLLDVATETFGPEGGARFRDAVGTRQPVVFVGPYEHHSNEVTWREGLATVVEVRLTHDGSVCLDHLEAQLTDAAYRGRPKIGSFSAASNVTGMVTPVHEVARSLHRHGAIACFDYAASGPYVKIDMNPADDPEASLDAVFISPHKFLGGPGSSGILVFNERLYHRELPPTVGGGGTVDYVGYDTHDFIDDIEEREKAGTPGVLQLLKASLAFQVKDAIGVERIDRRERELMRRAMAGWSSHDHIEILGNPDASRRVAIVSFNVTAPDGSYLHPKFVTTLANDLFGVQSRAGCSCAGPYGHRLLHIDRPTSDRYRRWIRKGYQGIKPGWCRIGFHYVMDDAEADFVIDAVRFIADHGHLFLPLYDFDVATGAWNHREPQPDDHAFSLERALSAAETTVTARALPEREADYSRYLAEAHAWASRLGGQAEGATTRLDGEVGELQYFRLPSCSCVRKHPV